MITLKLYWDCSRYSQCWKRNTKWNKSLFPE